MEEVTRRPTNMEVDDYAEYKRLRKLHREHKRKGSGPIPLPLKAAPPIPPLQLPANLSGAPQSLLRISPSVPRKTTFKEPDFDAPKVSQESDRPSVVDVVSPMTVSGLHESFFAPKKVGTLTIPISKNNSKGNPATSPDDTLREKDKQVRVHSPGANSLSGSTHSGQSELKEIIPWIELEATLPTPPPSDAPLAVKRQKLSQSMDRLEVKAAEMNPVKNVRRLARDSRQPSDLSLRSQRSRKVRERDTATNALNLRLYSSKPMLGKKKEKETEKEKHAKKIIFGKKPKLFDGARYSGDVEEDYTRSSSSNVRHLRSSSADDVPQLRSPIPIRPSKPNSLFTFGHGIEHIEFSSPLDDLISRPRVATPISSPMSPPVLAPGGSQVTSESIAMGKLRRWMSK
jgi:hypothetical protein